MNRAQAPRRISVANLLLAILCALVLALPALAHDPQLSSVTLRQTGRELRVSVLAPASRSGGLEKRVKLQADGRPLALAPGIPAVDSVRNTALLELRTSLPGVPKTLTLQARLFPDDPQSKTISYLYRDGKLLSEARLDRAHPTADLGESLPLQTPCQTVRSFVKEGVGHIFLGLDHICFVVGLLLLGGTLRQLLKVVTSFTLAHSITLCLAATGVWTPPGRLIEPLIALSIVAIGLDNLLSKPGERDVRAALALLFGLIHGFGFAGALADLGLPRQHLPLALGAFNVGVETGQATIVLLLAPVLSYLGRRWPKARRKVLIGGSVALSMLGSLWFVERILG